MSQLLPYLRANSLTCHTFIDTGRNTWVFWVRARKQFITHSYSTDQSNISPLFSEPLFPQNNTRRIRCCLCTHWHKYRRKTLTSESPDLTQVLRANPRDLVSRERGVTFIILEFKSAPGRSALPFKSTCLHKHSKKIVWRESPTRLLFRKWDLQNVRDQGKIVIL